MGLSVEQSREGKCELAEFIANRSNKVEDALNIAKEFGEAEAELLRSKKSRIQLLQEAKEGNCSCEGREGAWLEVAIQTLQNNGISMEAFCKAYSGPQCRLMSPNIAQYRPISPNLA